MPRAAVMDSVEHDTEGPFLRLLLGLLVASEEVEAATRSAVSSSSRDGGMML